VNGVQGKERVPKFLARSAASSVVLKISGHGLAKAIGEYLDSRRAEAAVNESLQNVADQTSPSSTSTRRISARTARGWRFSYGGAKKDVYFDGHEREDREVPRGSVSESVEGKFSPVRYI
jgi:hypothetical protein